MSTQQTSKSLVKVEIPNVNGRAVVTQGSKTYIIRSLGYHRGQEILIDITTAVEMPSFLFAVAFIYDDKTTEAIKFIKENF